MAKTNSEKLAEALEADKEKLCKIGIRYSESFMEIDNGPPETSPDRLWRWMSELINEVYHVGFKSDARLYADPRVPEE